MTEALIVGLIVAGAAAYIVYRYGFRKSGGCGCGCGSNAKDGRQCCAGDRQSSSCGCGK